MSILFFSEHDALNRCDIKLTLVEQSGDGEKQRISKKKTKAYP